MSAALATVRSTWQCLQRIAPTWIVSMQYGHDLVVGWDVCAGIHSAWFGSFMLPPTHCRTWARGFGLCFGVLSGSRMLRRRPSDHAQPADGDRAHDLLVATTGVAKRCARRRRNTRELPRRGMVAVCLRWIRLDRAPVAERVRVPLDS